MATKVIVQIPGEEDYAVRIGPGVIGALGRNLRAIERLAGIRDVLVLTDENVGRLYLASVRTSLETAGYRVSEIEVPAGESSKSVEVASEIWSAMAQLGFERSSFVVALGGGVVGDLAGFVASTYMRGVNIVQVPTTLLAMVDSSVGGKTAVNLPQGKNLVGTFCQPAFVCADTDVLSTLPEREWKCGLGEVAKSAVVDSDDFFFWLAENASGLRERDGEVVAQAIRRCVVFKADVVARDKVETEGVRECLNLGHTLGHAIEACCGYGAFSHGECVAEGMRFAAAVATGEFGCDDGSAEAFGQAQGELLDALGLEPLSYDATPEELIAAMKHDKKTRGGTLRFVLVRDIADWRVVAISDENARMLLEQYR